MSYFRRIQLANKIINTLKTSVQDLYDIHEVVHILLQREGSLNKIRDEFEPEQKKALFEEWQILSTNQYRFSESLKDLIESAKTFNESLKDSNEILFYFQIRKIEKEKKNLSKYVNHMNEFMQETNLLIEEATKIDKI